MQLSASGIQAEMLGIYGVNMSKGLFPLCNGRGREATYLHVYVGLVVHSSNPGQFDREACIVRGKTYNYFQSDRQLLGGCLQPTGLTGLICTL